MKQKRTIGLQNQFNKIAELIKSDDKEVINLGFKYLSFLTVNEQVKVLVILQMLNNIKTRDITNPYRTFYNKYTPEQRLKLHNLNQISQIK